MIKSRKDYKRFIRADKFNVERLNLLSNNRIKDIIFPDLIWQFQKSLRFYEYCINCKKGIIGNAFIFISYYRYRKLSLKLGFTIPRNVFDEGLSIPHFGTIVINPKTRVGKNCRLHVGVNIGASGGSNTAPLIGNNVYIGPGAIIFGDVTIANNVTVAANATVNRSVLIPNCVVAGTPARIVKENVKAWNEK